MLKRVKYQLRPVVQLHWAAWNDEYVVFDETSGQTHQLDAIRAFVLDLLSESPRYFSDLVAELSQSLAVSSSEASEMIHPILKEFETVGLVEATHS